MITDGRWDVCVDHSRKAGCYPRTLVIANNGRIDGQHLVANCLNKDLPREEQEANARLVAASKNMRDFILKAIPHLERLISENGGVANDLVNDGRELLRKIESKE